MRFVRNAPPQALALLSRLEAEDARVRVLRRPGPFNYPRLNNEAAREARGDVLVLLQDAGTAGIETSPAAAAPDTESAWLQRQA